MSSVLLAPTATRLPDGARGAVIVCASHGGVYAGYLIARAGARALILNDAGVGKDGAGVGSLAYCEALGMAAACVAHTSARIGDADDMFASGVISQVNAMARAAGCMPGMSCRRGARQLESAPPASAPPPAYEEARRVVGVNGHGLRVVCVDSVSLVAPADAGHVVLSGSHGGVVAGQEALAIKVDAAAAFFNDAGIGKDQAGISRLPVLDARGIAAATVAAASARIGDGRSTYRDGIVSRVSRRAADLGIVPGMAARAAVEQIRR